MINKMGSQACISLAAIIALVMILFVGQTQASEQMLDVTEVFSGDFPRAALDVLPEDQREAGVGSIASLKLFAAVWEILQPGQQQPDIDFADQIVLFVRNTVYYNAIRIGGVKVTDGVAEILAMETMSARPIEDKVGFSMAVVPRSGIRAVRNGDELIALPR